MPRNRATVREVAAATGVSIATVSRVLNQQGSVAPETRRLVERAVDELGLRAPSPELFTCAVLMYSRTTSA